MLLQYCRGSRTDCKDVCELELEVIKRMRKYEPLSQPYNPLPRSPVWEENLRAAHHKPVKVMVPENFYIAFSTLYHSK